MLTIGGFAFLLVCVFGSYMIEGGSIGVLAESLPFEMITIGGAAVGTFVMANSMHDVKKTLAGAMHAIKGSSYHKQDYTDLLCLLFSLAKLASSKGSIALEPHIEKPEESALFQKFPDILSDETARGLICDYLRIVGMNADDPHQMEDVMARELKKRLAEDLHPAHALQTISDGLPALGIVAAVLGVIKTMSHIDQPPAVLGAMIGGVCAARFLAFCWPTVSLGRSRAACARWLRKTRSSTRWCAPCW